MNIDKLISQVGSVQETLSKFNDVVDAQARELVSTHISYSVDEIKKHIENLQDKERELKIGIIGRVKAGKSSLINSLLFDGRDVLPKAATPMTAALTTIGSSDSFYAEVDFFSAIDIQNLADKKQEYNALLKTEINSTREDEKARQSKRQGVGESLKPIDEDKIEAKAKRILDGRSPNLKSASDLYERISRSTINPEMLKDQSRIEAETEFDLKNKLYDYVGADGKYMPFTRSVHVGMPLITLKDVLVIDTPGLNDAVVSREQRTYEMLKECNVVFIVSPAGQFLNEQDLVLADRLSKREGIQEIYVVASQVDLQLHGSERNKHSGILPSVINSVEEILTRQTVDTLSKHENEVLQAVSSQQGRLFINSGVCQSILTGNESDLDENAKHALAQLTRNYPDYFTQPEERESYLKQLANREPMLEVIGKVRDEKERILSNQINDFISVQGKSANEVIEKLIRHFKKIYQEIEGADLSQAIAKSDAIEKVRDLGMAAANNLYSDSADEMTSELNNLLKALVKQFRQEVRSDMESSEGSEAESYRVKKSGLINWVARGFGGGYEERTRNLMTLQASNVRMALEDLREFIDSGLIDATESYLRLWRKKLTSQIINKLRESIGDENVDPEKLGTVCRMAVNNLKSFPETNISELPAELVKSGKLISNEADAYIKEAETYLLTLIREANNYVNRINTVAKGLSKFDIGESLFDELKNELEQTKLMVQNKNITLDKLKTLNQQLEGAK